jgi:hypothetical protein
MPASSVHSNHSILTSPYPSNLGGNTNAYASNGGKTKKGHKKRKQSKKKRATKRYLFF